LHFKIFFTAGVLGTVLCSASSLRSTSVRSTSVPSTQPDVYARFIREFGGSVVNPEVYPQTVEGFQSYLKASGVNAIPARELTAPNHPEVAARLGYRDFLPPHEWWVRGAALALLTQGIQGQTQAAVRVRNWWRPAAYNADPKVGGAKNGDHPTANAFDLDYGSTTERMRAELYLRNLARRCPWLNLSLGLGALTTHVGIGSPRGHREWHYAGWRPAVNG
jgi:hypothetical protein